MLTFKYIWPVRFFVRLYRNDAAGLTPSKEFLCKMTEKMQADVPPSRQAGFVRYCLKSRNRNLTAMNSRIMSVVRYGITMRLMNPDQSETNHTAAERGLMAKTERKRLFLSVFIYAYYDCRAVRACPPVLPRFCSRNHLALPFGLFEKAQSDCNLS